MNNLQKAGGIAALYMAAAYITGITIFLFVLDYLHMVDPAQKVALLVNQPMVIYLTNLILYVIFGVFLIVFTFAIYERLKAGAPALMQVTAAIGIIWAGSLIASGMVSNAAIAPVLALYAKDPAQAVSMWVGIDIVAAGLGNGNGEILGGLLTLLISWAALQSGIFSKPLNYLGLVVGLIGIISMVPGLNDLTGLFGMTQIVWFVWLAIIMLRDKPRIAA